jgi:hypothetical protein
LARYDIGARKCLSHLQKAERATRDALEVEYLEAGEWTEHSVAALKALQWAQRALKQQMAEGGE